MLIMLQTHALPSQMKKPRTVVVGQNPSWTPKRPLTFPGRLVGARGNENSPSITKGFRCLTVSVK